MFTENDEAFLRNIREKTIPAFWKALEPLRALPLVKEVRGRGMMAAVEVCKDKSTGEAFPWEERVGYQVILEARRRGVHTRTIGDVVLCVPPLTIAEDEIGLLGRVMGEALDAVAASARDRP
jgi:adenosylmethionine-8-amino-7-oxononanoate aminotransferase